MRILSNLKLIPFVLLAALSSSGATFFAVGDFSTVNGNPNGVWTYGAAADNHSNMSVVFTLHDETASFAEWTNGNPFFFPGDYPLIGHNVTNAPLPDASSVYQPTELRLSANDPGNVADPIVVVRFTAPSAGFYQFAGSFQAEDNGSIGPGTHSEATINANNLAPLLTLEINGSNGSVDTHPFSFGLSLNGGNTVDFRVNACQAGGTCHFFSDGTGLTLAVTQGVVGGVPEPGSLLLAAGSLLALWALRFR